MPIYMDIHIVQGVNARAIATAHSLDIMVQEEHGCKCMTYWIDEQRESVFCLVEAPTMQAVVEMHNHAHGLIPHKIIEVNNSIVESFLGRIYDPGDAKISPEGLKVFSEPSFRVIVVTRTGDPVLLQHRLGVGRAAELLQEHNTIIRDNLKQFGGREVEQDGLGFILSFSSATSAVSCALAIRKDIPKANGELLEFRISVSSGEPIQSGEEIFGDSIRLARHLFYYPGTCCVVLASAVKALVFKDHLVKDANTFLSISPVEESTLTSLFSTLEEHWQDSEFDVDDFCLAMAMSKSQLYRKTIALTGMAPNILLRDFRLDKAKELMRKKHYNISQVTFDSGFTSPSYFTRCFKKKFGLLPMSYLELL